ncbi:MAG: sulfatase-like hydrolase/transferase [Solirubrobacterales bacterium]|nr:sulfatase-like hydrolase/transferase [Solirubrobacterales bacterium]
MRLKLTISLVFALLVPAALAASAATGSPEDPSSAEASSISLSRSHPNIIYILTDDLDRQSFNPATMPRTFSYLKDRGTTFRNNVIPMPTCCPSRGASLSGQYNHNNDVLANERKYGGGYPGYYRTRRSQGISLGYNLGSFMQNGGYRTALVGKYMNVYGDEWIRGNPDTTPEYIPGWNKWFVPIQNRSQKYYNYKVKFNEAPADFEPVVSLDAPKRFTTDVKVDPVNRVAIYSAPPCDRPGGCSKALRKRQRQTFSERIFVNQVINFLGRSRSGSTPAKPSFVWYATDTPHGTGDNTFYRHKKKTWGGPEYSPLDRNRFTDMALPRTGAFNEPDVSDKPPYIRNAPSFDRDTLDRMLKHNRARWRSLYSLDRELGRLYDYLERSGLADRTVIAFTSDNGYMAGQHRLSHGKQVPYRESTEFPIIFRGPGIAAGRTVNRLSANFDLPPTVLGLANLPNSVVADPSSGKRMPFDGVNLKPYMTAGTPVPSAPTRKAVVLESVSNDLLHKVQRFRPFKGVRTDRYAFIRYYRPGTVFDCPAGLLQNCLTGRGELYDLERDPDQKNNLMREIGQFGDNPGWRARNQGLLNAHSRLKQTLNRLEYCSGSDCLK